MANIIKLKRGLSANINSAVLQEGEIAITIDTNELYTNNGNGNVKITQKGETGDSGVYIGSEPPTDENVSVWIDTDDDTEATEQIPNIAIYTSEEVKIGTWMGKNLYRRVLYAPKGNYGETGDREIPLGDFIGVDIDNIWLGAGSYFTELNRKRRPFNFYDPNYYGEAVASASIEYQDEEYGVIARVQLGSEIWSYGEYALVIEYTKKSESNTFSFWVEDWSFKAERGMTWAQWLESDYNILGFYEQETFLGNIIALDGLGVLSGYMVQTQNQSDYITTDTTIIEEGHYWANQTVIPI